MMVLDYAENGSLRNYLDTIYYELNWYNRIIYICRIEFGLQFIHGNGIIHRDLHVGNILINKHIDIFISDTGLCKPVGYNASENMKKSTYGVLPYMAPEIL